MKPSRRAFLQSAVAAAIGTELVVVSSLLADDELAKKSAGEPSAGEPWQARRGLLMTRWSKEVTPDHVWSAYPRPLLVRDRWLSLNGLWNYQVTGRSQTDVPRDHAGQILVPFPIESPLSGVMKPLLPDQRLWYRREFAIPVEWTGQRMLLHFGAVDWESTVYIDEHRIGSHRGGYDPFSFDITNWVKPGKTHAIVVSVWDASDTEWQLHGKQALHPGGCSYTACSGIWQTVWLEPVPESHVQTLRVATDVQRGVLKLSIAARTVPEPLSVSVSVKDGGTLMTTVTGAIGSELTAAVRRNLVKFFKATAIEVRTEIEVSIRNPKLWSPDSPFLYDLAVELRDNSGVVLDLVTSYFGMRSVTRGLDADGTDRMLLNGQPILLPGALDQGFWPDGVYLAPTDDALRFDIEWAKKLGLNTLRKHVKIEPQRWYYWADKLGIMIFQDMPTGNCGDPVTDRSASPEAADQWRTEVGNIIDVFGNHPSIVCWTLFNEAFGGFNYIANAAWAAKLDPSRLINESSGFPWHGVGDIQDGHGGIDEHNPGQIQIVSESGTPSLGCSGHEWPHAWSYGSYDPKTGKSMDFLAYYNKHMDTAVLPDITPEATTWLTKQLCSYYGDFLRDARRTRLSGNFYCQLIDVETECDGLLSYDRDVSKVDADDVAQAIRRNTPKLEARRPVNPFEK